MQRTTQQTPSYLVRQTFRQIPVRMGVLHILVLIIALCLAVLSVLALTTAQASQNLSARQGNQLQQVYAAEVAGQQFLASVDNNLAWLRGQNLSASEMASTIATTTPFVKQTPQDVLTESTANSLLQVTTNVEAEGDYLIATFTTPENQCLRCVIALYNNATYEVLEWKSTKLWNKEESDKPLLRIK